MFQKYNVRNGYFNLIDFNVKIISVRFMSDDKLILILIYILMVKLCCVFSYLFLQIMSCVVY